MERGKEKKGERERGTHDGVVEYFIRNVSLQCEGRISRYDDVDDFLLYSIYVMA